MAETRTVAKAILVADNKILILRRSETDKRRPLEWDLPGGSVEPGEDIKQACVREVAEETGIAISTADCKTTYAMTEPVEDGVSATWIFFRADVPLTEPSLSEEHVEARWVMLEEALQSFKYERQLRALRYIHENRLLVAATSD